MQFALIKHIVKDKNSTSYFCMDSCFCFLLPKKILSCHGKIFIINQCLTNVVARSALATQVFSAGDFFPIFYEHGVFSLTCTHVWKAATFLFSRTFDEWEN